MATASAPRHGQSEAFRRQPAAGRADVLHAVSRGAALSPSSLGGGPEERCEQGLLGRQPWQSGVRLCVALCWVVVVVVAGLVDAPLIRMPLCWFLS